MAASITATELKVLIDKVCEHDKFIDGNGSPGAKTRLALMENAVGRIEASLTRMTNWFIGLIITIVTSTAIWFLTTQLPKITAIK